MERFTPMSRARIFHSTLIHCRSDPFFLFPSRKTPGTNRKWKKFSMVASCPFTPAMLVDGRETKKTPRDREKYLQFFVFNSLFCSRSVLVQTVRLHYVTHPGPQDRDQQREKNRQNGRRGIGYRDRLLESHGQVCLHWNGENGNETPGRKYKMPTGSRDALFWLIIVFGIHKKKNSTPDTVPRYNVFGQRVEC